MIYDDLKFKFMNYQYQHSGNNKDNNRTSNPYAFSEFWKVLFLCNTESIKGTKFKFYVLISKFDSGDIRLFDLIFPLSTVDALSYFYVRICIDFE